MLIKGFYTLPYTLNLVYTVSFCHPSMQEFCMRKFQVLKNLSLKSLRELTMHVLITDLVSLKIS